MFSWGLVNSWGIRNDLAKKAIAVITVIAFFNEFIIYGGKRHKLYERIKSRLNKLLSIIWRDYLFRFITWVVILTFLTTTMYQDLAWANTKEPLLTPSSKGGPVGPAKFDLKDFILPSYLGYTENVSVGASDKIVIHIQDAHCNYAAQTAIYNLIEYLNRVYNVKLINLEGGTGECDLSVFTDIIDRKIRRKVADYFLKEGRINGPQFFALNNPDLAELWGIDSKDWYFKNLDSYRNFLPSKNTVDRNLNALKELFLKLKQKTYPKELFDFDKRCQEFDEHINDFKGYITYLTQVAETKNINTKDLENISCLLKVLSLEAGIDFKEAENERSKLIDELERRLSKVEREELVLKAVALKATTLSQKDFYAYIKKKADEARIDFRNYPNLARYIGYIYIYGEVDNKALFEEISKLEERIKEGMYQNAVQRELALYSRCFGTFYKLLNIKATKRDYDFFENKANRIDINKIIEYVQTQCEKSDIDYYLDKDVFDLKKNLNEIASFYNYANKRDRGFIDNTLGKMESSGESISVVVTGGFHTENLKELFEERGISYVSVTPNFGECNVPNKYFERLAGKLSPIEEYFLGLIKKYGTDIEVVTIKPARREESAMMQQTIGSGMEGDPRPTALAVDALNIVNGNDKPAYRANGYKPIPIDVDRIVQGAEEAVEPEEKPGPGKGVIWLMWAPLFKLLDLIGMLTPKVKTFIEDFVAPLVEEGLMFLLASHFESVSLYIYLRIGFALLHLFQNYAPPEGRPRTLFEKIALPALISTVSLLTLGVFSLGIFTPLEIIGASSLAGLAVHILANRYVTRAREGKTSLWLQWLARYQKGVLLSEIEIPADLKAALNKVVLAPPSLPYALTLKDIAEALLEWANQGYQGIEPRNLHAFLVIEKGEANTIIEALNYIDKDIAENARKYRFAKSREINRDRFGNAGQSLEDREKDLNTLQGDMHKAAGRLPSLFKGTDRFYPGKRVLGITKDEGGILNLLQIMLGGQVRSKSVVLNNPSRAFGKHSGPYYVILNGPEDTNIQYYLVPEEADKNFLEACLRDAVSEGLIETNDAGYIVNNMIVAYDDFLKIVTSFKPGRFDAEVIGQDEWDTVRRHVSEDLIGKNVDLGGAKNYKYHGTSVVNMRGIYKSGKIIMHKGSYGIGVYAVTGHEGIEPRDLYLSRGREHGSCPILLRIDHNLSLAYARDRFKEQEIDLESIFDEKGHKYTIDIPIQYNGRTIVEFWDFVNGEWRPLTDYKFGIEKIDYYTLPSFEYQRDAREVFEKIGEDGIEESLKETFESIYYEYIDIKNRLEEAGLGGRRLAIIALAKVLEIVKGREGGIVAKQEIMKIFYDYSRYNEWFLRRTEYKKAIQTRLRQLEFEGVEERLVKAFRNAVNIVDVIEQGEYEGLGYDQAGCVTYHGFTHSGNHVLKIVEGMRNLRSMGLDITEESIVLAAIAAMLHDVGYYKKDPVFGTIKVDHEERSKDFVREYGGKIGLTKEEIDIVRLLITATDTAVGVDVMESKLADMPLGIMCGAKLLAVLDLFDTRENGIEYVLEVRDEFNMDRDRLLRYLQTKGMDVKGETFKMLLGRVNEGQAVLEGVIRTLGLQESEIPNIARAIIEVSKLERSLSRSDIRQVGPQNLRFIEIVGRNRVDKLTIEIGGKVRSIWEEAGLSSMYDEFKRISAWIRDRLDSGEMTDDMSREEVLAAIKNAWRSHVEGETEAPIKIVEEEIPLPAVPEVAGALGAIHGKEMTQENINSIVEDIQKNHRRLSPEEIGKLRTSLLELRERVKRVERGKIDESVRADIITQINELLEALDKGKIVTYSPNVGIRSPTQFVLGCVLAGDTIALIDGIFNELSTSAFAEEMLLHEILALLYPELSHLDHKARYASLDTFPIYAPYDFIPRLAGVQRAVFGEANPLKNALSNYIDAYVALNLLDASGRLLVYNQQAEGAVTEKSGIHMTMKELEDGNHIIIATSETSAFTDLNDEYGHTAVDRLVATFGSASHRFISRRIKSLEKAGIKFVAFYNPYGGRWHYVFSVKGYDRLRTEEQKKLQEKLHVFLRDMLNHSIEAARKGASALGLENPNAFNAIIGISRAYPPSTAKSPDFKKTDPLFSAMLHKVLFDKLFEIGRRVEQEIGSFPEDLRTWLENHENSPPERTLELLSDKIFIRLINEYRKYLVDMPSFEERSQFEEALISEATKEYFKQVVRDAITDSRDLITYAENEFYVRTFLPYTSRYTRRDGTENIFTAQAPVRMQRVFNHTDETDQWLKSTRESAEGYRFFNYFGLPRHIPHFSQLNSEKRAIKEKIAALLRENKPIPEDLRRRLDRIVGEEVVLALMTEYGLFQGTQVINTLTEEFLNRGNNVVRINGDFDYLSQVPSVEMGDTLKRRGIEIIREEFRKIGIIVVQKGGGDEWVGIGSVGSSTEGRAEQIARTIETINQKLAEIRFARKGEKVARPIRFPVTTKNGENIEWTPSVSCGFAYAGNKDEIIVLDFRAEKALEKSKEYKEGFHKPTATSYGDRDRISDGEREGHDREIVKKRVKEWFGLFASATIDRELIPYTGLLDTLDKVAGPFASTTGPTSVSQGLPDTAARAAEMTVEKRRIINNANELDEYFSSVESAATGFMANCKWPERPYVIFLTEDNFALISRYFGIMRGVSRRMEREYHFNNLHFYIVRDEKELQERSVEAKKIFDNPDTRGLAFLGGKLYDIGKTIFEELQSQEKFFTVNTVYPDNGYYHVTGLIVAGIGLLDYKVNPNRENLPNLLRVLNALTGAVWDENDINALLTGSGRLILPRIDKDQAWFELRKWLDRDEELGKAL